MRRQSKLPDPAASAVVPTNTAYADEAVVSRLTTDSAPPALVQFVNEWFENAVHHPGAASTTLIEELNRQAELATQLVASHRPTTLSSGHIWPWTAWPPSLLCNNASLQPHLPACHLLQSRPISQSVHLSGSASLSLDRVKQIVLEGREPFIHPTASTAIVSSQPSLIRSTLSEVAGVGAASVAVRVSDLLSASTPAFKVPAFTVVQKLLCLCDEFFKGLSSRLGVTESSADIVEVYDSMANVSGAERGSAPFPNAASINTEAESRLLDFLLSSCGNSPTELCRVASDWRSASDSHPICENIGFLVKMADAGSAAVSSDQGLYHFSVASIRVLQRIHHICFLQTIRRYMHLQLTSHSCPLPLRTSPFVSSLLQIWPLSFKAGELLIQFSPKSSLIHASTLLVGDTDRYGDGSGRAEVRQLLHLSSEQIFFFLGENWLSDACVDTICQRAFERVQLLARLNNAACLNTVYLSCDAVGRAVKSCVVVISKLREFRQGQFLRAGSFPQLPSGCADTVLSVHSAFFKPILALFRRGCLLLPSSPGGRDVAFVWVEAQNGHFITFCWQPGNERLLFGEGLSMAVECANASVIAALLSHLLLNFDSVSHSVLPETGEKGALVVPVPAAAVLSRAFAIMKSACRFTDFPGQLECPPVNCGIIACLAVSQLLVSSHSAALSITAAKQQVAIINPAMSWWWWGLQVCKDARFWLLFESVVRPENTSFLVDLWIMHAKELRRQELSADAADASSEGDRDLPHHEMLPAIAQPERVQLLSTAGEPFCSTSAQDGSVLVMQVPVLHGTPTVSTGTGKRLHSPDPSFKTPFRSKLISPFFNRK